jgi:hypothetical protein
MSTSVAKTYRVRSGIGGGSKSVEVGLDFSSILNGAIRTDTRSAISSLSSVVTRADGV